MLSVRLLTGEKAGEVIEAEASVAQTWIAAGRAELVAPEKPETPEGGVRRRRPPRAETRG